MRSLSRIIMQKLAYYTDPSEEEALTVYDYVSLVKMTNVCRRLLLLFIEVAVKIHI